MTRPWIEARIEENLVITSNVITKTGGNNIVVTNHQGTTEISSNTLDAGCAGADAILVATLAGGNVTSLQKVSQNTIDMGTGGADAATGITFMTGSGGGQFSNIHFRNSFSV